MRYRVMVGICGAALAGSLFCAAAISQAKTVNQESGLTVSVSREKEESEVREEAPVQVSPEETKDHAESTWPEEGNLNGGIQVFLEGGGIGIPDELLSAVSGESDESGVPEAEELQENEYADLAIADVNHYVNVRREPNTDSEIVGKIYDGAVAHILSAAGEEGDWFQVVSGSVEGYIKAEFFLYGPEAAAVIDEYVTRYATVQVERLNVRREPDIEASRIGYIDNGEKVRILEDQGEWLKIRYADTSEGYVASRYVTVTEEFMYAKTLEEEARELEARRAQEERQRAPEEETSENMEVPVPAPAVSAGSASELRQQIVDYAMQFLGNKYVHGGQSLSGGTDCSGFTSLIYAEFGYSLSRTPAGQLSDAGRSIDYSEIQPGDVICYGSGGKCTHVALYIGDGQIIHAANSRKGVIISDAGYDTILGVKNIID